MSRPPHPWIHGRRSEHLRGVIQNIHQLKNRGITKIWIFNYDVSARGSATSSGSESSAKTLSRITRSVMSSKKVLPDPLHGIGRSHAFAGRGRTVKETFNAAQPFNQLFLVETHAVV
jgi:hypothetical protein